jgi:hypothetical protein
MPIEIQNDEGAQALDINEILKALLGFGVRFSAGGGCAVSSAGGLDLDVAAGEVVFDGSPVGVANQTVSVTTDKTNPRKSVVYVDGNGNAQVVEGTPEPAQPAGNNRRDTHHPQPPDLRGTDAVVLAEVWVPAGAGALSASDIADRRINVEDVSLESVSVVDLTIGDLLTLEGALEDNQTNTVYDYGNERIGPGLVASASIAAEAVGSAEIADAAVESGEIAAGAVTGTEIADGAVDTADLAPGGVTSAEIADGTVDTADLAADAVTAAKILANAVDTSELATDAVTATEITTGSVGTGELADGAVDTPKLAADAVTAAKILADAVTRSEIAGGAVGTGEIAAGAVTGTEISDGAVDTADIAPDAVTAAKILADAVGVNEIDQGITPTWTGTHTFDAGATLDGATMVGDPDYGEGVSRQVDRDSVAADATTDGSSHYRVDTSNGDVTITIATADAVDERETNVKNIGDGTTTIATEGTATVAGESSIQLDQPRQSVTLVYHNGQDDWEVY